MLDAADFKAGERVKLVKMDDPYRGNAPIGIEGTVISVAPKPVNVVNVDWDGGFGLNPCLDVDVIERIEPGTPRKVFEVDYRETYGGTFYVVADGADEAYGKLQHYAGGDYLSRRVQCIDVTWTAVEVGGVDLAEVDVP